MTELRSNLQPAFYKPQDMGARPWGTETLAALVPGNATLKILHIKAGHKGRLQRHHYKDEAGYVQSGELLVRFDARPHPDDDSLEWKLEERVLHAGDSFHFPPGCIHQEEALTDCVIIEVSTPHRNDREGCEELFGLEIPEDALPSTTPDQVELVEPWF